LKRKGGVFVYNCFENKFWNYFSMEKNQENKY
jgi:hypothetical protein